MAAFERFRKRLFEKAKDVTARPVLFVAFGDSVTQGCMEYATIEHDQVYHQFLKRSIEKRVPATILSVINAGVAGDTAFASLQRWERDVLLYQPDLVTISFGVNDAHEGEEGVERYEQSIKQLIHLIRAKTAAELLLVTPTMMMKRDNENVHEKDRDAVPKFLRTAESGYLQMYAERMIRVAKEENVACVDVYDMWCRMERDGIDIHSRLVNGLNHPDRAFHKDMAAAIEQRLFA